MSALDAFHPLIRRWFQERYGVPTEVQDRAWPVISAGRHLLAVAPTGSGKTLCAFLWSLDRLASGSWEGGSTRVVYVSPLKALNNDIRRNLLRPLGELRRLFESEGEALPELSVLTRSGDTPERERRRMLRRPPEILITTPESLNLLVSSPRAREIFRGLRTVILDEIHAVASSRRGTHLVTAVERLVPLAGEFQRIALSATVDPPERVAAFVGGFRLERTQGEPHYRARSVELVHSPGGKSLDISVHFPPLSVHPGPGDAFPPGGTRGWEEPFWGPFVTQCLERIRANRSTLIFTNTRRHAEKVARLINERAGEPLAYAHHGSLSREIRAVVERKLKRGELSAISATSSLELGIDIGELDEVLLLQTPFSVASTLQRIGRAGHGVGEVSRGRLYATHGRDLLNAAVMARRAGERKIEEVRTVEAPLDVLAQVLLSMVGLRAWGIDELYDELRTSSPYRMLPRRHYELVLDMLAGRYADSRIRELQPRVILDRPRRTVSARGGALPLVYRSGGTIPDRGQYELRLREGGARLGELDEEFVWERKEGDTFSLGTQSWRITRIDARSVEVVPWSGPVGITPFWRAEKGAREFSFCAAVGALLEGVDRQLPEGDPGAWLGAELHLDAETAEALAAFLARQRRVTGTALPHRHHLLIEHVEGPLSQAGLRRTVLHTLWGGRVNEPLALVLSALWTQEHFPRRAGPGSAGTRIGPGNRPAGGVDRPLGAAGAPAAAGPEIFADDDCLMFVMPEADPAEPAGPGPRELLRRAARVASTAGGGIEELLRLRLEGSGFFGARFRENAGRALLLPRSDFRHRVPLWLTRLRSKRLLEAVRRYPDFPLLLETWRSCLQEEFDLDTLRQLLGELARGEIRLSETHTTLPSPFAENITWVQTNQHVYEGDSGGTDARSRVAGGLLRELVTAPHLRPRFDAAVVRELEEKLQRTARGYSPGAVEELRDWVRERLWVAAVEWTALLAGMQRDHGLDPAQVTAALQDRLVHCRLPGAEAWGVCARERLSRLLELSEPEAGRAPSERLSSILTLPLDTPPGAWEAVPSAGRTAAAGESTEGEAGGVQRREEIIAEWLRYYGPLSPGEVQARLGVSAPHLKSAVERLVEEGVLIYDLLTSDATEPQVCDAENVETLLRFTRRAQRREVRPRPIEELALFLALRQGVWMEPIAATAPGVAEEETLAVQGRGRDAGAEGRQDRPIDGEAGGEATLQARLEPLFGYPAAAGLWEAEIFPARIPGYTGRWLDTLLSETGLLWFGCGRGRLTFSLEADQELFRAAAGTRRGPQADGEFGAEVAGDADRDSRDPGGPQGREGAKPEGGHRLQLAGRTGRFTSWELAEQAGISSAEVTRRIWQEVWAGRLSSEGFDVLRRGLGFGFRPEASPGGSTPANMPAGTRRTAARRRRGSFDRWRLSRPLEARWFALGDPEPRDLVEAEELNRDRVGQLLERYGILFRELLQRELPALRWSRLFRTLRVMELSGDVLCGYFFESIRGLQFLAPDALTDQKDAPEAVYWLNAADPASPCGLGLELVGLPSRLPSNHLVYHGSRLVLVSTRGARSLEFRVPPGDPAIPRYFGFLAVRTRREWRPANVVRVETINGEAALDSPYKPDMLASGFAEEYRTLVLRARP